MQTPAQAVVCERRGVVVYHLAAVAPTYALAAVRRRIPYRVIFARFRSVGEQLVSFVLVLHAFELALLYVLFQRKVCCAFAKDIPVIIVTVQPRFSERFVLVPHNGCAVFVDAANVAHLVVFVLDAFRNREIFSAYFRIVRTDIIAMKRKRVFNKKILFPPSYIYFIEKAIQQAR